MDYKIRNFPVILYFAFLNVCCAQKVKHIDVKELRCEYLVNPLGIDTNIPRLSWQIIDKAYVRGQKQTGYHILVASNPELLTKNEGDLWDSGKIKSSQSALVSYAGKTLVSNQDCYWKVRVFDKDGKASNWSKSARFSIGLLADKDWTASWIRHPNMDKVAKTADKEKTTELATDHKTNLPVEQHLWFRKNLNLSAPAKKAFLHVASCGYHELYVNGKKADNRFLAPAQTRLDKRILYVTYDISDLLVKGDNVIAFWTGPGWSRYTTFNTFQALRVQLNGEDEKGKSISLETGKDWRCHEANSKNRGKIKYRDHGGEIVDAQQYIQGWNLPEFDDTNWDLAEETTIKAKLSSQMMEPTRIIETISAKNISGEETYFVDLGKNFTGWVELKIRGQQAGDVIKIKVADDDKTGQDFGQLNEYICTGIGEEVFRNRFNYIAGRYVTIEGLRQKPELSDVKGLVLATDIKQVGHFTSSKELFNKIYEADLWTYRANTVEGFTMDCPHRERLGYGEVAFATSWGIALPNYQSGALYMKHVRDWADVQTENGWFYHTAPQINHHFGGPMWSSAGLNIASAYYQVYGDQQIFERIYPSAIKWLEYLNENVKNGVLVNYSENRGKFLGDWAAPKKRKEWGDTAEAQYFNNCVYAMNLADVVRMAQIQGKEKDAEFYQKRLDALRKAIHQHFFNSETNTYSNGTQVQQAFALMTGLAPKNLRDKVFANIEKELTDNKAYLDMGSSGLPVLFKYMIEESGRSDLFFKALSSKVQPSYGYFIERGENTWPEYWNVDVPSRIHTCYTGVASWMTKSLAGIRPDPLSPGFQSFIIQPILAGDLSFVEGSTTSLYGEISSRWERNDKQFTLNVSIPPNSQATVYIPTNNLKSITENGKAMKKSEVVTFLRFENEHAVYKVEAGKYQFKASI
ncbi:family 78 glycoside hydrolase catalytic domain [Maribacter luteus]|uniref:family 78 glycoside hydrolase catalytic domain n=1 Tax=Maribacter luteus TaxID=2594478 RepID=UPI002491AF27|nr:family 78 glycoside hydrolase catalytic domain [Maribacter luteus]